MRPPSEAAIAPIGAANHALSAPGYVERFSELRAAVRLADGRPEFASRYHTSPLKIAKAFRPASGGGRTLAVVQMDGSPGMLEGDRYSFDWEAGDNVRLYVTNQAYTRVHPCGFGDSRMKQKLTLGPGAVLEWMPEPIMLFKDARFVSETEISLSAGSVCFYGEIVSPGRLSRGESFAYASYDGKLSVLHEGELTHYQRQRWEPSKLPLADPGCFGGHTHVGAFYAFSDRLTPDMAERVREKLEAGSERPDGVDWGVARTARFGFVVQAAGPSAWKLQKLLVAAWDAARELLLNEPPLRLMHG